MAYQPINRYDIMYIILNKITSETAIIKEKSPLAEYLGISLRTVQRKGNEKIWETDSHIIYIPDIVLLKSRRGGREGNIENLKR